MLIDAKCRGATSGAKVRQTRGKARRRKFLRGRRVRVVQQATSYLGCEPSLKPDNTVLESIAYTYDENGNRVSKTGSTAPLTDTPFTATYDAANRMVSLTLTAGNQTYNLSYDDNGNLTQKQNATTPADKTNYTWDAQNRLTAIQGPNGQASFKYDALGRRLERTVNGQSVQYLYDGAHGAHGVLPAIIFRSLLSLLRD